MARSPAPGLRRWLQEGQAQLRDYEQRIGVTPAARRMHVLVSTRDTPLFIEIINDEEHIVPVVDDDVWQWAVDIAPAPGQPDRWLEIIATGNAANPVVIVRG